MAKNDLGWKLLCSVFVAALLTLGMGLKAADAAKLTHHELTVKDEMGKPLGKAHCIIRGVEGNYAASVVASVDGFITAMAHPGATVQCISKELNLHTGKIKSGWKDVITKKQELKSCWACNLVPGPLSSGKYACCEAAHKDCKWKGVPAVYGSCVNK
ncbi:MAG: hypothetical protein RX316_09595 [bacterium]|nr:hypothetical protein [bacterium]